MITTETVCVVECDKCKSNFENKDGGVTAFSSDEEAKNTITQCGWEMIDDECYCEHCWEVDEDGEPIVKGVRMKRFRITYVADNNDKKLKTILAQSEQRAREKFYNIIGMNEILSIEERPLWKSP